MSQEDATEAQECLGAEAARASALATARHAAYHLPTAAVHTAPHTEPGPVAQRLEQGTHNPLVVGSNPTGPTRSIRDCGDSLRPVKPPRAIIGHFLKHHSVGRVGVKDASREVVIWVK